MHLITEKRDENFEMIYTGEVARVWKNTTT